LICQRVTSKTISETFLINLKTNKMKTITEKQMELADDIFWLIMEYVDTKQFIKYNGDQPSESTEQGRELLYSIEDLLTKTK